MPVCGVIGGECPLHRAPGHAGSHMGIIQNVNVVIEVRELMVKDGIIESQCHQHQYKAPKGASPVRKCKPVLSWMGNHSWLRRGRCRAGRQRFQSSLYSKMNLLGC